jgi:hypothetical protein
MSKAYGYGLLNAKYNTLQQLILSNQGGGGGGTQDLQSVLDQGASASDNTIVLSNTNETGITSRLNNSLLGLEYNSGTNIRSIDISVSTPSIIVSNLTSSTQDKERSNLTDTQLVIETRARFPTITPEPATTITKSIMTINDGALNGDNKTIEVEPTGLTISQYDNSVLTNSIEITPKTIAINSAYGTAGQVLTSGGSAGTLSWADGGGGTQDLQEVLDEGNTAQDIAINLTNSFSPTTQAIFSSNGVSSLSNTTNSLEATLTSSEIRIVKNTTSTSDEDRTTLIPSQLKMRLIPRFPDITPAKEAIYDIDKVLIDDKALNGDNKKIEMKPTGITISGFDNSVLTNEIVMDNTGFSVENITTSRVAYINLTAGLSLPPSSAITLENTAGTNGYVITSNGTTASWQPAGGGGGWVGTAESNLDMVTYDITSSTGTLNLNATDIEITGQANFVSPPHIPEPILGNDAASKGYVDSLVGQYSGGFNLFMNYSNTDPTYTTFKELSALVNSAAQQTVPTSLTTNSPFLLSQFITLPLGITEIPIGLWDLFLYSKVNTAQDSTTAYFELWKRPPVGLDVLLGTSGTSGDINNTNTPTSYSMTLTISTAISLQLSDRVYIKVYGQTTHNNTVILTTYYEGNNYSFVQTTLNSGTTLLSSNNTWTGTNNFVLNPTTPSKTTPAITDIINYGDIQRLSTPIVSTLDYYITTDSPFFQYPPAPPTNTLLNTYQYYGWYFINSVIGRSISWYFAPDYAMTVGDVKGLYMNYFNITTTSNDNLPFISIYTKPTGTNDVLPGFAHSVATYIANFTPTATTPFCSFMNISGTQQDPFPYGHILGSMILSPVQPNPRGEYLSTEEVLAVAVGTNSGSALNQVAFIMSKVGICLEQGNQELILNPQNIIVPPNLTQTLTSGNAAGGLSITGVNNLAATSVTTATLSNGANALTVGTTSQTTDLLGNLRVNGSSGTSGYVLTSTGASTAPTWQASGGGWVGTATSNLNMANYNITACPNIDSATSLTLGGGVSTSVSLGKLTQTTDLVGNVKVNGTSGTSGQVLTSTGATTAPTFQTPATPYISASGVASGAIDMGANAITNCPRLDSASALALGGTTSLGTTLGRSTQTTNLVGNVQINGSSGTSGQVLTSTGASTAPTWSAPSAAAITALQGTRVFSGAGNSPISNTFSFQKTTITADAVGQKYMFIVNVSILDGTTTSQSLFMSLGYIDGNTNVTSSGFNINNNVVLTTVLADSTCLASVKSTSTTAMNNTITFTYIYTWAGALTKSFAFVASGGNTFIINYGSISYVKLG